jgi:hypothetical protein
VANEVANIREVIDHARVRERAVFGLQKERVRAFHLSGVTLDFDA